MKLHFLFAYPVLNKTFGTAKGYLISRPNNWVEFTSESVPGAICIVVVSLSWNVFQVLQNNSLKKEI